MVFVWCLLPCYLNRIYPSPVNLTANVCMQIIIYVFCISSCYFHIKLLGYLFFRNLIYVFVGKLSGPRCLKYHVVYTKFIEVCFKNFFLQIKQPFFWVKINTLVVSKLSGSKQKTSSKDSLLRERCVSDKNFILFVAFFLLIYQKMKEECIEASRLHRLLA